MNRKNSRVCGHLLPSSGGLAENDTGDQRVPHFVLSDTWQIEWLRGRGRREAGVAVSAALSRRSCFFGRLRNWRSQRIHPIERAAIRRDSLLRTTLYGQLWSPSATAFDAPVSASSRPRFAAFVARAFRCENRVLT